MSEWHTPLDKDGFKLEVCCVKHIPSNNRYEFDYRFYDNGELITSGSEFSPSPMHYDYLKGTRLTLLGACDLLEFFILEQHELEGMILDAPDDSWITEGLMKWAVKHSERQFDLRDLINEIEVTQNEQ